MLNLAPVAAAALVLFGASAAQAGCANYVDGSLKDSTPPRAIICFKDKCGRTILEYECANTSGSQAGYAVGWTLDRRADGSLPVISWQGKAIPRQQAQHLTCYEIDRNACHFPNSLSR